VNATDRHEDVPGDADEEEVPLEISNAIRACSNSVRQDATRELAVEKERSRGRHETNE